MSSPNSISVFFTCVPRNPFVICTTLKPDISFSRNQAVSRRKKGVQARIEFQALELPLRDNDYVLDLVSARRRHGALIRRLGYLGHHSWHT